VMRSGSGRMLMVHAYIEVDPLSAGARFLLRGPGHEAKPSAKSTMV
jgi:hypothetical protein